MKKVFINGCFDILHRGHFELFKFAKELKAEVIVAIDSDDRITNHKGPHRPINCLEDRKFVLSRIIDIDKVLSFGTDEELIDLVKSIRPDHMIVGSDWKGKTIVGGDYAKEIIFFERINGYSTTKTLQSSANR